MGPVDIGIGHDNDPVITQAADVEVILTNARPQGRNERAHLV